MNLRYKVLCIGVNEAPGSGLSGLKYAEKNAAAAAKYFATLNNSAHVTLLTGGDASKAKILSWMTKCNEEPVKDLTVILFFSGYASAEKEEGQKSPERFLLLNSSESTGIVHDPSRLKISEILESLKNSLHRLIVVIDACFRFNISITGISPEEAFAEFKKSERLTSLKPYVIISSTAVKRYIFEDPILEYGVLTYYFLQTISGKYTFFLQKEITVFRFLETLYKKVGSHRYPTQTGRKRIHTMLPGGGIMAHASGKNFKLPILEPTPFLSEPGNHFFKRKISKLAHFLTCSRLRRKFLFAFLLTGIVALFIYLLHVTTVRIHFTRQEPAAFHTPLLEKRSISLGRFAGERLGKKYYDEFSIYMFKYNWAKALKRKPDTEGKIILSGNLFGERIDGIAGEQIVEFALRHSDDVFYWHSEDVLKLLRIISHEYRNFDINRKSRALKLLAKLGKNGKTTALGIFDFARETNRNLRDLFLENFYSIDFLKRNIDKFNPDDYLCLKKKGKQVPHLWDRRLREKTDVYLRSVAESIPDSRIEITDQEKVSSIYDKLQILASFGSSYFRKKAAAIFKKAFHPDEVFGLSWNCRDFRDRLWLLKLNFKRVEQLEYPSLFWDQLIYRYIPRLSGKEKTGILEIIMDTNLELVPPKYRNNLMLYLRDVDPQTVDLSDWENWLQRYQLDPQYISYIVHWIIDKDYEQVFPFLENYYDSLKGAINERFFTRLYEFNKSATINLAKTIFRSGDEKVRLYAAVFLYNKNILDYSSFLINFLEKVKDNTPSRQLLVDFYGSINEAVIKLIGRNENFKKRFEYVVHHPDFFLFYRFFSTNMRFWPQQAIKRIMAAKIPGDFNEGRPLLKMSERLPDVYRKKMLFKIVKEDIDTSFKWKVESALAEHFPGEFLKLVFDNSYRRGRYTDESVIKAYRTFSYEKLIDELLITLKRETYWQVGFICTALLNKNKEDKGLNTGIIRDILAQYDRPLQRIVLRELRYYMNRADVNRSK